MNEAGISLQVEKTFFILLFAGDRARTKIMKICEAFGANLYPFPEEPNKQQQMKAEVCKLVFFFFFSASFMTIIVILLTCQSFVTKNPCTSSVFLRQIILNSVILVDTVGSLSVVGHEKRHYYVL